MILHSHDNIKLLLALNHHTSIDLEMQVNREDDWTDRSLSYLCRNYDKLFRGQAYEQVHPAMHIGILDFDLFPDELEFYASYMMLNIKNHKIFNNKFILNVLSLNQIELATDTDRRWQLDTWARLFKAKTWEEIHMIAKQNKAFASAAQTLYQYNEDERIRWQYRQREDYDRHERIQIKKIQDLTEQVSQQKTALAEKDQRIAELETLLKEKQ